VELREPPGSATSAPRTIDDREPVKHKLVLEPDSPSAEPFRTLRLAIDANVGSDTRGLVFTSPRPRDGRSTLAASYAAVTAFVQRPVLLIDADMRNPSLHEMFGVNRSPGLVEALSKATVAWCGMMPAS